MYPPTYISMTEEQRKAWLARWDEIERNTHYREENMMAEAQGGPFIEDPAREEILLLREKVTKLNEKVSMLTAQLTLCRSAKTSARNRNRELALEQAGRLYGSGSIVTAGVKQAVTPEDVRAAARQFYRFLKGSPEEQGDTNDG